MPFRPFATAFIALALLAAACSDDTGDAATTPDPSPSTSTSAPVESTAPPTTSAAPTTTTTVPLAEGSVGCGPDTPASGAQTTSISTTDGRARTFRMYVPTGYDPMTATPLVLNFHGLTSNIEQQVLLSRLEPLADEESFIVVTPQGTENESGVPYWNLTQGPSDEFVDDIQFVHELLDHLESILCVDLDRVFSTGMSNGGFLSTQLACAMPDRIAAVASVTGITSNNECEGRPVPVLHFHGTADGVVNYESIPDRVATWATAYGCDDQPTETEVSAEVTHQEWTCPDGADVEFYTVTNGGHTWPSSPLPEPFNTLLGHTTFDVDATALAWDWFVAHPRTS